MPATLKRALWVTILAALLLFLAISYRAVESLHGYGGDHFFPERDGYYLLPADPRKTGPLSALFDGRGVLLVDYAALGSPKLGAQYQPVAIAQFVLEIVAQDGRPEIDRAIRTNLDYLVREHAETRGELLLYPYHFDWPKNKQVKPWYSSMAQGMVASALVRGYLAYHEPRYLAAAEKSVRALTIYDGPFAMRLERGVWLQEYPDDPCQVLDGTLAAIAGVFDTYRALPPGSAKQAVRSILDASLLGFKSNYRLFKSSFGHYFDECGSYPSSGYYQANIRWLNYLSKYDAGLLAIKKEYLSDEPSLLGKLVLKYSHYLNRSKQILLPKQRSELH